MRWDGARHRAGGMAAGWVDVAGLWRRAAEQWDRVPWDARPADWSERRAGCVASARHALGSARTWRAGEGPGAALGLSACACLPVAAGAGALVSGGVSCGGDW